MSKPENFPEQQQSQPGDENKMMPEPEVIRDDYRGSEKLKDKVALITGGDSGIGRSAAVHFAREGADVAIVYYDERGDAEKTQQLVENEGRFCMLLQGDLKEEEFCKEVVQQTIEKFGKLDILINNAAMQFPKGEVEEVSSEQFRKTFSTNLYPYFYIVKESIPHLKEEGVIINTTSVTACVRSTALPSCSYSCASSVIGSANRAWISSSNGFTNSPREPATLRPNKSSA